MGIRALFLVAIIISALAAGGCVKGQPHVSTPTPLPTVTPPASPGPENATGTMIVGVEYAFPGMADAFSDLGVSGVKYYPGLIAWSKMQKSQGAPIDFSYMDRYVKEYQDAGFTDLVIALNTKDSWAIRDRQHDYSPKPDYLDDYGKWVGAVVERYDLDGKDDMPGLRAPVRYYEAGEEFSTYEPELVENYLAMLEEAHRSAHDAYNDVVVMNAAFLATNALRNSPGPGQYEQSFGVVDKRIMYHSLTDIRKVLDRPDIFDAVDFHSLGDPYEIEDTIDWLQYEMGTRGYNKPIVIGDTATTPFIAWGPATIAQGNPAQLGIVVTPATEGDRPRLAAYFQKLVDGDRATVEWTHAFAAQDVVKKVVVAANRDVTLIDTAFMEDLALLKLKLLMAGAGTSAWAGMADTGVNVFNEERTIKGLRPSFYALKQLNGHISGYRSVERVPADDSQVRLYRFTKDGETVLIAWFEPDSLGLPGDTVPQKTIMLPAGNNPVTVEYMIEREGQTMPDRTIVSARNGTSEITLTPMPVYVY